MGSDVRAPLSALASPGRHRGLVPPLTGAAMRAQRGPAAGAAPALSDDELRHTNANPKDSVCFGVAQRLPGTDFYLARRPISSPAWPRCIRPARASPSAFAI
jgi:hypothetical protein